MNITATYRPISFKDPTGLEPEKEKGGEDEMLWTLIQQDVAAFAQISLCIMNDLEGANQRAIAELMSANPLSMQYWNSGLPILEMGYVYAGAGGGGSGARGGVSSNNGRPKNALEYAVDSKVRGSLVNSDNLTPDEWEVVRDNFMSDFWEANPEMSYDDFLFYMSQEFNVYIGDENFQRRAEEGGNSKAVGLHFGQGACSDMWFRHSYFTGNWDDFGTYNGRSEYYNIQQVIMHEFGHSWGLYKIGDQYNTWKYSFKENWAIHFSNTRYSSEVVGIATENYWWTWQISLTRWMKFLYPNTSGRGWNP